MFTQKRGSTLKPINKFPADNEQMVTKFPSIYRAYAEDKASYSADPVIEEEIKQIAKQQSSVLQSARQIFSIAINCL